MNHILDEIDNGQLFPATTYYKNKQLKSKNDKLEKQILEGHVNPFETEKILISEKIYKKIDILQNVDTNNDIKMFDTVQALERAHTEMNHLTPEYFHEIANGIEQCQIVKQPRDIEEAEKQVIKCFSDHQKSPMKCSQLVTEFVNLVKEVGKNKEEINTFFD